MEELDGRNGQTIPQQSVRDLPAERNDPVGEALLSGYLAEVDAAAAAIITPQKTDDLLLRIKVHAFTEAAVETHQSGDDTLTNLVVQRDLLSQVDIVPPPSEARPVRKGLGLAVGAQLGATVLALLQMHSGSDGSASDASGVVTITAMVTAFLLTAVMLSRRPAQRRPLKGLSCTPVALSRSRRAIDVAVASIALLLTAPVMAITSMYICVRGRPVIERKVRVGQGGRPIRLLKYRLDGIPSRSSRWLHGLEHFPRLWNLLRGDLTLIGPKPEPPEVAVRYPQDCRWVFRHRPGLIGAVYEDARDLETDTDRYLAEVVPAQVHGLYRGVLFNKRLAPRLVGNAAIAMVVFRAGSGRRIGLPAPEPSESGSPCADSGTERRVPAAGEHFRIERWSLHEPVTA
ncbi:sugar transferase [Streptomyces sp. NPDC054844]